MKKGLLFVSTALLLSLASAPAAKAEWFNAWNDYPLGFDSGYVGIGMGPYYGSYDPFLYGGIGYGGFGFGMGDYGYYDDYWY